MSDRCGAPLEPGKVCPYKNSQGDGCRNHSPSWKRHREAMKREARRTRENRAQARREFQSNAVKAFRWLVESAHVPSVTIYSSEGDDYEWKLPTDPRLAARSIVDAIRCDGKVSIETLRERTDP